MWRDLRVQSKLLLSFLSLGLLAVLMTGWQSYRSAKTVLEEASLNALAASCDTEKRPIQEDFARTHERQPQHSGVKRLRPSR